MERTLRTITRYRVALCLTIASLLHAVHLCLMIRSRHLHAHLSTAALHLTEENVLISNL